LLSKAMPSLILGSVGEGIEAHAQADFDTAISILRQQQNLSGGFGLWQASPDAAPFASLYASDFLLEAKESNYPVPGDLLNRANAYLSQVANGPSEGLSELRNRAYAAYLLTRQEVVTSGALALAVIPQRSAQRRFIAAPVGGPHPPATGVSPAAPK
jgi:uncharacterized protein YfaS (alpha-2-macroglobulin family)